MKPVFQMNKHTLLDFALGECPLLAGVITFGGERPLLIGPKVTPTPCCPSNQTRFGAAMSCERKSVLFSVLLLYVGKSISMCGSGSRIAVPVFKTGPSCPVLTKGNQRRPYMSL